MNAVQSENGIVLQEESTCDNAFVVACGHREIQVPKTGNRFPAFLVYLPKFNDQSFIQGSSSTQLVWRSRRDFMLLARSCSSKDCQLPKAALTKVAEKNVPWIRPVESLSSSLAWRKVNPSVGSLERDEMETFLGSVQHMPNKYAVEMKRSLWQLDQFLQQFCIETNLKEIRHEMAAAWQVFCRPHDTSGLAADFVDLRLNGQGHTEYETATNQARVTTGSVLKIGSKQQSSRLGQYFASKENARKVVEIAMKEILSFVTIDLSHYHFVFTEPSCGYGDIVIALIRSLEKYNIPPANVSIRGYDIDPNAIVTCQQRQEFLNPNCIYSRCISWKEENFLNTAPQFNHLDDSTDKTRLERGDPSTMKKILTCCLGGPPYTKGAGFKGAGCSSAVERDLPTQFVEHCQYEWNADNVTFLLPDRYRNVKIASNAIWDCETHELESSTFYFQGTEQVTQPSIIKSYSRRPSD
jgi:hypothetical protein